MVQPQLELTKQRGTTSLLPLLAILVLAFMPAASAYTATLVSPTNINNVHNGALVSIQVNGLVVNDSFQLNISSADLKTPGGTFSINNFAMPFGFVNGTASTSLVGSNLNASGLQLVVARADGVTIIQQNQTTSNPYRIFLTNDILKTSYNVSITGYPLSSTGAIIDFSVHGNTTSPNNPAFLNFTISNIQSGHLQIRVSNGTADQLNTTLTITSVAPTTGVYRPGAGFYLKMDNGSTWNPSTDKYLAWDNAAGDLPIAGDWNADGRTETGVYRPGAGFYLKMDNGTTWNPSTDVYLAWDNAAGDLPIAGDWNVDGRTETGVYRPGAGFYLKMDNGTTWNPSTDVYLAWDNAAGDLPIAGDWNEDGRTETGVYRPGVGFYLKMDNTGTWNPSTDVYLAWDNAASDRPIAGDWNADGRTETGVYRPGAGFYLKMDNTGTWNPSTDVYLAWDNAAGDRPIAGNFV